MKIAVLADIHSNIIALESVLSAIKKHGPDQIISLGDQVNLGPSPRETMDLLRSEGVTCLHGNHERYILAAMDNHPGYQGVNFSALKFNAGILSREEITLPKVMEMEGVTFCHALPDDDRFPVYEPEKAIDLLLRREKPLPAHIICGHGHNPTNIRTANTTIQSIGSVGCMDDGVPGTAPYAIVTAERGCIALRPYYADYDVTKIRERFIRSGLSDRHPIMAHIACLQMTTNKDIIVPFVARASAMSKKKGESMITQSTWEEADKTYPWPDGMTSLTFWKR